MILELNSNIISLTHFNSLAEHLNEADNTQYDKWADWDATYAAFLKVISVSIFLPYACKSLCSSPF